MHEELIIKKPVTSTDIRFFTNTNKKNISCEAISDKIYEFVIDCLVRHKIQYSHLMQKKEEMRLKHDKEISKLSPSIVRHSDSISSESDEYSSPYDDLTVLQYFIDESVKNSFDAYSNLIGASTEPLLIKTVISTKPDGSIYLKIKDNGPGIKGLNKGARCSTSEVVKADKSNGTYLGGQGVGLKVSTIFLGANNHFLKNRKNAGAANYLLIGCDNRFKLKRMASELPEESISARVKKRARGSNFSPTSYR